VQHWKQVLLEKLGKNVQVIIDIIPDLELIVGKQPPLPAIPQLEVQVIFMNECMVN
jgi:predicted ATPase